jgi:FAD/FMN-containing dehydrogenase
MLADDLKDIIQGDITNADADRVRYSRDASIFEVKPEVIVYPKGSDDLKHLVKWVSEHKVEQPGLSLTARSAGTDMSGGPLNNSIILDFTKYFNHVLEVGENYAIVEPGVYYRDFEKETLAKDLLLPSYPASRELCAMGGIVANNSGGEKSLSYGKTERYVAELNVVLSDGNEYVFRALTADQLEAKKSQQDFEGQIYRNISGLIEANYDAIMAAKPDVSKNSAGYSLWNVRNKSTGMFDLTQLFVGSQGTLGLVTKIRFNLIKPKKFSKLLVISLDDMEVLGDVVKRVMAFKPESFELYDDKTMQLAEKFIPEAKAILEEGMPKLMLIAEFTGDEPADIDAQLALAQSAVADEFHLTTHITQSDAEEHTYWMIRRESFNLLRQHSEGKHTAPFIDDVVVHVDQLASFIPKLNELIAQYPGMTYTIAGHAGDANFHVIPLLDFTKETNRKSIPRLSEKVYDLVISLKGSISGEHNDGLIRTPYLEKMYGPQITALFKQTKEIFDPLNIFNPGKKVNGDVAYIADHIIKS